MIQSQSLDRLKSLKCVSVIKRFRIFYVVIVATVCTISSSAAEFGSPEINLQSRRDNLFISTNWDETSDFSVAEQPFTAAFYRLQSISATDVKPYLINAEGEERTYFKNVVCIGNQLILSDPEIATNASATSTEHFYLVIPAGAVVAEDGTTNPDEYRRGFMKLPLELTPHVIDGKIVDYYTIEGEGANYNPDLHITMYSPTFDQIEFFGGHAMSYDFNDQGTYDVYATVNMSFIGDDGMTYCGSTSSYGSIELDGISSEFELSKQTNTLDHVTRLVASFSQNETMAINRKRAAEYPYIENEAGERTYFNSHDFTGSELHLTLDSPLSESGNYRLIIPQQFVYHLYENGAIAVPNKYEVSKSFAIGNATDNSSINMIADSNQSTFDVYTVDGVKVASKIGRDDIGNTLPTGMYILTNSDETLKLYIK